MGKLTRSELQGYLDEDQTCQGCDRDHLDCVCCEPVEDSQFPDWEGFDDDPDFYSKPYDDSDDYCYPTTADEMWWYEEDRLPLGDY